MSEIVQLRGSGELVEGVSASRDSWCTPRWLTDLLPFVDLDPASNSRSTVRARKTYSLERGEDGLSLPWSGLVWLNPPFSDIYPWAIKAERHNVQCGFLVNVDSSTSWWKRLQERRPIALLFHKRIQFDPPHGVKPSTNSKPQALLMDEGFWAQCEAGLSEFGTIWRRQ